MDYEIKENVLSEGELSFLRETVMWNENFPWYLTNEITFPHESEVHYATHMFYNIENPISLERVNISNFCTVLQPIVDKLEPKSILRMRANFYPKTPTIIENEPHTDYPFTHKSAIFSLNTCNGFTRLGDDITIDSVENRLLLFDSSMTHNSTTCSDTHGRFNINFNYF